MKKESERKSCLSSVIKVNPNHNHNPVADNFKMLLTQT